MFRAFFNWLLGSGNDSCRLPAQTAADLVRMKEEADQKESERLFKDRRYITKVYDKIYSRALAGYTSVRIDSRTFPKNYNMKALLNELESQGYKVENIYSEIFVYIISWNPNKLKS